MFGISFVAAYAAGRITESQQVPSVDKTKPASAQQAFPSNILTIERIDNETYIISKGFPYRHDVTLTEEIVIPIDRVEIVEGRHSFFVGKDVPLIILGSLIARTQGDMVFPPTFTRSKLDIESKGNASPLPDAVGIIWKFSRPEMNFTVEDVTFSSLKAGATVRFTDKGVVIQGFKLSSADNSSKH
jgi:hypothetical protein